MKTHELIKNHKGLIFFYPFSGTDFKIITELKNLATVFNKKALFVYCSFGGSQQEFEYFKNENYDKARGLHTDTSNIENKLGLQGIEISTFQKLTDVNFDASYYSFDDVELIFVRGEAFHFIECLQIEGIDLFNLNLILSYAQGFDEELKKLILKFSKPTCNEVDEYDPKMITINNHYLTDVEELFADSELYKWRIEFEVKEYEFYTILFEKKEFYSLQRVLRAIN
jgi:hypothetical protein